ncbi:MAG TPA: hypothetical protein VMY34_00740 [Acidimicrobiales bacterium]|nr:hypothetical protein [Acidimicrobiales bacterium]
MRGKWATGIEPRYFTWVIKGRLAISERPGGYARNHRKVRRQEEIIWLREQGFSRVVSLLASPHNLYAYDELGVKWSHFPLGHLDDGSISLTEIFENLRTWMASGEKLLLHQEELADRVMGVAAGFLVWALLVPSAPQAITALEQITKMQMGPPGRELVAMADRLKAAKG